MWVYKRRRFGPRRNVISHTANYLDERNSAKSRSAHTRFIYFRES